MKPQDKINEKFLEVFGETPINERLSDLNWQMINLKQMSSIKEMKNRLGYLICSAMQLAKECDWDVDELIDNSLENIETIKDHYKKYGRKINVAIFGGSFNPPHKGHIQFAKSILDNSGIIDEVWMMPCNQSLYGKGLETGESRIEMCKLAIGNDHRIKVCDWEIENETSGETYKIIKEFMFSPEFRQYNFYFAIGMDNAYKASSWVNWEWLEKFAKFLVVPRKGIEYRNDVDWFKKSPHICLDEVDIMEVSSTEVKNMMKEDDPKVYEFIDKLVLRYISAAKLYGVDPGKYTY